MSQFYQTTYVCDNCGTKLVVDDLARPQLGEPGWWYLRYPDEYDTESADFCSAACLVAWVEGKKGYG